jgi:hypothetical protein
MYYLFESKNTQLHHVQNVQEHVYALFGGKYFWRKNLSLSQHRMLMIKEWAQNKDAPTIITIHKASIKAQHTSNKSTIWAFKFLLFYLLFSTSSQAPIMVSNMDDSDSDKSVAIEIDFTVPGNTRWYPVGANSSPPLSPPPKESNEERCKQLKRERE